MRYADLFAAALAGSRKNELSTAIEALIEESFGLSRTRFWIQKNQPVRDAGGLRRFRRAFARLRAGEPLAYILRRKEFYGESFLVTPAVLVPRPETELLVGRALELIGRERARILDIGSGSGCIAIVLALKSPARVTALEASRPALRILRQNVDRFGVRERVRTLAGDLFPPGAETFQMIVSNPPYLSRKDWRGAPVGVRCFEPRAALVAGPAGTEVLARIVAGTPRHLAPGGRLLLEIGHGQRRAVRGFLAAAGMREIGCVRDYAGIERVIVAQKNDLK